MRRGLRAIVCGAASAFVVACIPPSPHALSVSDVRSKVDSHVTALDLTEYVTVGKFPCNDACDVCTTRFANVPLLVGAGFVEVRCDGTNVTVTTTAAGTRVMGGKGYLVVAHGAVTDIAIGAQQLEQDEPTAQFRVSYIWSLTPEGVMLRDALGCTTSRPRPACTALVGPHTIDAGALWSRSLGWIATFGHGSHGAGGLYWN